MTADRCPSCGAALATDARYCGSCGAARRAHVRATRARLRTERRGARGAALALQWAFVVPVLGTVLLAWLYVEHDLGDLALYSLHGLLMLAGGGLAVYCLRPGAWRESTPLRVHAGWLAASVPLAALMFGVSHAYVEWLFSLVADHDAVELPEDRTALLLAVLVLAPVLEEWLCRGVLWIAARRLAGDRAALVVSAVLFAFLHGLNGAWLLELPHRFVGGLLLGWLRLRSGSLLPCVFAHFLNNLVAVTSG